MYMYVLWSVALLVMWSILNPLCCRFGVSASLKTLPHRGKMVTASKDCTVGKYPGCPISEMWGGEECNGHAYILHTHAHIT